MVGHRILDPVVEAGHNPAAAAAGVVEHHILDSEVEGHRTLDPEVEGRRILDPAVAERRTLGPGPVVVAEHIRHMDWIAAGPGRGLPYWDLPALEELVLPKDPRTGRHHPEVEEEHHRGLVVGRRILLDLEPVVGHRIPDPEQVVVLHILDLEEEALHIQSPVEVGVLRIHLGPVEEVVGPHILVEVVELQIRLDLGQVEAPRTLVEVVELQTDC